LEQLNGVFQEIEGYKFWIGKGYGWSIYYMNKYDFHPTILCFESIFFSVLCNSGFIGLCIWIIFFYLFFKLQRKILIMKKDIHIMDTMLLVYVAYVIGTGVHGYFAPFSVYYTFILCCLKNQNGAIFPSNILPVSAATKIINKK
jgi:O-antigen ligase